MTPGLWRRHVTIAARALPRSLVIGGGVLVFASALRWVAGLDAGHKANVGFLAFLLALVVGIASRGMGHRGELTWRGER